MENFLQAFSTEASAVIRARRGPSVASFLVKAPFVFTVTQA